VPLTTKGKRIRQKIYERQTYVSILNPRWRQVSQQPDDVEQERRASFPKESVSKKLFR